MASRRCVRRFIGLVIVLATAAAGGGCLAARKDTPRVIPAFLVACARLDYTAPGLGALAWADEFDGPRVDPDKWRVRDAQSLSFDAARILADNVTQSAGMLTIHARRSDAGGRAFTSGYLDTIGRYSRQYGRWEIRAKLPTTPGSSRGLWPAFWLRADDLPGEIDVMEAWGSPDPQAPEHSADYAWTVHKDTTGRSGRDRVSGWVSSPDHRAISADFHVFAVDWSPRCLRFSVDGHTVGMVHAATTPWLRTALAGPVNIRLNLQIGSRAHGFPTAADSPQTRFPAAFTVDYVRVFRPIVRH